MIDIFNPQKRAGATYKPHSPTITRSNQGFELTPALALSKKQKGRGAYHSSTAAPAFSIKRRTAPAAQV
jgi:hypothetical protein